MRIEALAGEQTGEAQKKFSNRMPVDASLSRLGVTISSFPAQPIAQAPWSSLRINRMLGVWGSLLAINPLPILDLDVRHFGNEHRCNCLLTTEGKKSTVSLGNSC